MKPSHQKITFHIGVHKTGTTFLQDSVFANVVEGTYLGTDPSLSKLVEGIATGEGPFLVSGENLSGRGHFRDYGFDKEKMISSLATLFDEDSKVILFFREPSSWIISLYKHYVRMGGVQGFHEWREGMKPLQYGALLDAVKASFPERFLLFSHAQLVREQEAVISAIEKFSGLRFSAPEDREAKNPNISLKRNAMRLARYNNIVFKEITRPGNPDFKFGLGYSDRKSLSYTANKLINESLRRPVFAWLSKSGSEVLGGDVKNELKSEYQDEWRSILAEVERNQKSVLGEVI